MNYREPTIPMEMLVHDDMGLRVFRIPDPYGGPGLQRYPVDEKKAEARAAVERLHDVGDRCGGHALGGAIQDAAVLLDECQAGRYLFTPEARSGWVLVPATTLPKVRAAVEGLIHAMERSDAEEFFDDQPLTAQEWFDAKAGGRAILAVVEALEAQS